MILIENKKIDYKDLDFDNPIYPSISVDVGCWGNPGLFEFRGIDNETMEECFHLGPFPGTSNIGEFLAIVEGLRMLKANNCNIPIYSDSYVAIQWVSAASCRTKFEWNESNKQTLELISNAQEWLRTNIYEGKVLKWKTWAWGENPSDFGRK